MFGFERLHVYQRSIEFLSLALRICASLPKGHGLISDQLRRASMSVPLNIAEGVGRMGLEDNRRHFAIARGSAMECAALLDVLGVQGLGTAEDLETGRRLLLEEVRMLTAMCLGGTGARAEETKFKSKTKSNKEEPRDRRPS